MADSPLDFAGLDASAATAVVDAPAETNTEVDASEAAVTETQDGNEVAETEGSEKVEGEAKEGTEAEAKEDLPGDEKTPAEIRKALKAFRDHPTTDPKEKVERLRMTKQLHNSYERWNAATQIFPKGVDEMRAAKEFMDLVGGQEGYDNIQSTLASVEASDNKLYAGDASLLDDIYEDLKSAGKPEVFAGFASPLLDKLKTVDEKAYYSAMAPHFFAGVNEIGIPQVIASLTKALTLPENATPEQVAQAIKEAGAVTKGMKDWYDNFKGQQEKAKNATESPEAKKLREERANFEKQVKEEGDRKVKAAQDEIFKEADKVNKSSLGEQLKSYISKPFFKGFKRDNFTPLATQIQLDLREALKGDKTYQAQVKSLLASKNLDRAKIIAYHQAKVQSLSPQIVRAAVEKMYPGYATGGAAAGRVAAANQKKAVQDKAAATSVATGKPIYVATKPDWDSIDFSKDPKQYLYVTGKAYLKSGKLVTWRR